MFLFIFESIGTSELILIGIVALVVFGPRKLPQFAKTIGKTMADFRRTTNEFKSTWEKEVNFEEEERLLRESNEQSKPPAISKNIDLDQNLIATPEIREIDEADFNQSFQREPEEIKGEEIKTEKPEQKTEPTEKEEISKKDWL